MGAKALHLALFGEPDRSHHLGAASCRDVPGTWGEQAPAML